MEQPVLEEVLVAQQHAATDQARLTAKAALAARHGESTVAGFMEIDTS
jgi:hypothetical protein